MKIGTKEISNTVWLAPMAGVTDLAYRKICKDFGCDVVVTEMVSAKALYHKDKKTARLIITETGDLPVALQIFGSDPIVMKRVTREILNGLSFDFLDINMGCPAPKIVKNGDGSALMKNVTLAKKIVFEIKSVSNKPVTVKIRSGWDSAHRNGVNFAKQMADAGADAITIHGRTREQMYAGYADWQIIKEIKQAVKIPVIGNGDIFKPEDALNMFKTTHCDAVMIGRGAQGQPWLFSQIKNYMASGSYDIAPSLEQRIAIIKGHMQEMMRYKPEFIAVLEMRKHVAWYLKGIPKSADIKRRINHAKNYREMLEILMSLLSHQLR